MQKIKFVILKDLAPKTEKVYDLGDCLHVFSSHLKFDIQILTLQFGNVVGNVAVGNVIVSKVAVAYLILISLSGIF